MAAVLLNKLQPGKTYTVAVKAIDSDGNVSPNSLTYTFTTPTTNLDGTSLVGYNSAVNVSVGASGAMTAGTMDLNGLQKAGQIDLNDVWNTTNLSNGGGYASITGNIGGVMILNKNGLMGYQITSDSKHINIPITASFGSISSTFFNETTARSLATVPVGSVLTIGQAVNSIKIYNVSDKITASANLLYNDYTKTASGSNVGAKMFVNFYSSAGTFLGNVVGASIVVPNSQETANYLSISASATASAYPTTSTAHITIDFYPIAGSAIGVPTSFFFTNPITTNSGETIGSSSGIAKFLLNNKTGDAYFGGTIFTTSKIGTLPIVDWTASQINNNPLVGSAYNLAASAFNTAYNAQNLAGSAYNLAASGFNTAYNAQNLAGSAYNLAASAFNTAYNGQILAGSAYNVAAQALLDADSASSNTLNHLGVTTGVVSGSALISSANTIVNAQNQITRIQTNGLTIGTSSVDTGARVVLNSVGFAAYDSSGSPTVTITASNGTAMFTGSVIATAGVIGGFNLSSSPISSFYIGTASQQNWTGMIPGTQWSFFSGAVDNTGSAALFRVSNAGLLYAQNAVITGTITAQAGVVGNWNIGSQSLWAGNSGSNNFTGMYPGSAAFFAGATASTGAGALFQVTNSGAVYAANMYASGTIAAQAGVIGNWNIGLQSLWAGNSGSNNFTGMYPGSAAFFAGATASTGAGALFQVTNSGAVYAANLYASGTIAAQAGVIGNWNIGSQSLWAGNLGSQNFAGMIPGTLNVFFGGATSSAADNPTFRVTNTGSVLATAGYIGGWSLGQTSLSSRNTKNIFSQYDPSFENGDYVNYWKSSFYSAAGFSSYILSDSSRVDGLKSIVVGRIATSPILGNFYTYPFIKMYKNPTTLQRFSISDLNLTSGSTYVFSAYVNSGANWSTAQVGVYVDQYTASSGGTLKGSSTAGNTVPAGTWTRVSSSFTASANSYFEFIVWSDAADNWYAGYPTTAEDIFYVDAVQLESGNTATTYQINNAIVISSSAGSSPMQFGTPTNDGGIISNLSVSPEGVLNAKGLTLYGTQPFNIATGVATTSSAAFTTITLPAGRFSATPRVTATIRSNTFSVLTGYYSIFVGNESKSSFTVYTASGATSTTANSFSWIAVQI